MRKVLSFFDSTTKVLVAIGGMIAAVIAIVAGVHQLFGTPTPGPSPSAVDSGNAVLTVAQRVSQCESAHGMSQQRETKTIGTDRYTFESCVWPPAQHSDADGHTLISVLTVDGPDPNQLGYNLADRVTGPCDSYQVTYDFGHMGVFAHLTPFAVEAGAIDAVTEAQGGFAWNGDVTTLPFYPERREATVLHNANYIIREAVCQS